jgi:hypothetical protein
MGKSTLEADETLNTYTSSLRHLEAYESKLREDAAAKRAETKKKRKIMPPFLYRSPTQARKSRLGLFVGSDSLLGRSCTNCPLTEVSCGQNGSVVINKSSPIPREKAATSIRVTKTAASIIS